MSSLAATTTLDDVVPVIEARQASKLLPDGVTDVKKAFVNLNLAVRHGERLAFFSDNTYAISTLVECLSGVTQLDRGEILHHGSVSWPVGTNQAFNKKLSGYSNALFAAQIYSRPGCIRDDLLLIQELTGVDDYTFHEPLAAWKASSRKSLELAVSLAFEFDVLAVGKIDTWDHRAGHPDSVRIRRIFESRIEGRSLLLAANGQPELAMDYCDKAIVIINGSITYQGAPQVCHQIAKEEIQRKKSKRRHRANQHNARLVGVSASPDPGIAEDDVDDASDEFTRARKHPSIRS